MLCALGADCVFALGQVLRFPSSVMRRLHFAFCILYFVILTSCSQPPEPIQVSHSGAGAYEAALATDEKGFAVAWYDTRDGNAEIYMRLLDDSGRPSGPERRLTETPDASVRGESRAPRRRLRRWRGTSRRATGGRRRCSANGIATAVRSGCRRLLPRRGTPSSSLTDRPSSRPGFRLNPIPLSGCTWAPGIGTARIAYAHPCGRCFEDDVESQYRSRSIRGVDCLRRRRVYSCERTVSCARGRVRCPPRASDERRWGGVEVSGLED